MMTLENFLRFAGLLHFAILMASLLTPGQLKWREHLAPLPTLLRRLFWVYGVFIVVTIIGLGTLTLRFAPEMAAGEPVARGLCGFTAVFWGLRLLVQMFVFDARPFLTNWFYRVGYHGLTAVFTYLTVIYALAVLG